MSVIEFFPCFCHFKLIFNLLGRLLGRYWHLTFNFSTNLQYLGWAYTIQSQATFLSTSRRFHACTQFRKLLEAKDRFSIIFLSPSSLKLHFYFFPQFFYVLTCVRLTGRMLFNEIHFVIKNLNLQKKSALCGVCGG